MQFSTATLISILATLSLTSASTLKWDDNYSVARNLPLTSFACSNGPNGLITKYNDPSLTVDTLESKHLKPGVVVAASYAVSGWGSAACGGCYHIKYSSGGKTIEKNFIAIDHAQDAIVVGSDAFSSFASPSVGSLTVSVSSYAASECYAN